MEWIPFTASTNFSEIIKINLIKIKEMMSMNEFPYHMIREIHEEYQVVEAILNEGAKEVQDIVNEIQSKQYELIYITGSGTSYHAGLAGQYALSMLTRFVTSLIPASELPVWIPPIIRRNSLLISISQSGESIDVLAATKAALTRKIDILALTNTPGSSLTKMSNYTLLTRAGKELAVTATKSYVAQLMTIFMLSLELASRQEPEIEALAHLRRELFTTPNLIAKTINSIDKQTYHLAEMYRVKQFFFILGSGPNYATALEGALKLKEACNIYAEGFASREFLHGPIQLVNERTPVLFLLSPDEIDTLLGLIETLRKFEAPVISISEKINKLEEASTEVICIPESFPKIFSPVLYIIPLQLFSYYSSIARGLNPDEPEKLTKVVK
ncbi:MAG: SIS domain-containing protein [Candidatus Hodarchaeota archaeon]